MRILVLDDDQGRLDKFALSLCKPDTELYIARTADVAIQLLAYHHFDMVFLDHDLGLTPVPDPGDGSQVVQWIAHMAAYHGRFQQTKFYIHSMNDEGKPQYMIDILHSAGLNVKDAPLVWEDMYRVAVAS